jgi:hypothetical protein
MQSEVLGRVQISRSNIVSITLGASTSTNPTQFGSVGNSRLLTPAAARESASPDASTPVDQTNLLQSVRKTYLNDAGPEANDKFNELMGGFLSGKLTVDDIRAQAKTAVEEARSLRKDLGEDAGTSLDTYINILDKFLKEPAADTNAAVGARSSSLAR